MPKSNDLIELEKKAEVHAVQIETVKGVAETTRDRLDAVKGDHDKDVAELKTQVAKHDTRLEQLEKSTEKTDAAVEAIKVEQAREIGQLKEQINSLKQWQTFYNVILAAVFSALILYVLGVKK